MSTNHTEAVLGRNTDGHEGSLAGRSVELVRWRLKDVNAGSAESWRICEMPTGADDWIDVDAPGDVYLALQAAGRLVDPFGDRAEPSCAWVKYREWWYRSDFDMPLIDSGERLILDFEGLDTFATIWLNGEVVGATDNMFRRWRFDVTGRVREGVNRLAVSFTPPSVAVIDKTMPVWPIISDPIAESKRNFVRKAQFGWGWDFGPRLPTVGIWKAASLRVERSAVLQAVKFTTLEISACQSSARVAVEFSTEVFAEHPVGLQVQMTLHAPSGMAVAHRRVDMKSKGARFELSLENPMLWWTPELGAANLYRVCVSLLSDGTTVDRRDIKVGVRTISLDTTADPDEPGTSFFRFILNGVPIYARGVNWIPPSSFPGAVAPTHYRQLLELAAMANMNMVRNWGGGIYEHDAFYDSCDELGLLVWQDFMFACAPYPEHDATFNENVRAEVHYQIERLRHHPCLALWCGGNETHAVQAFMNRMTHQDEPLPGALFYDQIMPQAVAELDPGTPYWPSSPFGGPNNSHNSMREGDVHNWTVWHGLPPTPVDKAVGGFDQSPAGVAYSRYAEDMARFVGEFGIQASPVLATLKRMLPVEQQALGSPGLLNLIKDKPLDKVNAMLLPVTGLPRTLEEYVDFTQITQAEGLKFGIEHYRRRKPHCSGSLIWQYNDCWPGVSWSIVDNHGQAKAGYYFVRRAYAPVMASFKAANGGIELWVVNDTLRPANGKLTVARSAFSGESIWSETISFDVAGNASSCVWRGNADRVQADSGHLLTVRSDIGHFPDNRYFFASIKELDRPRPVAPNIEIIAASASALRVRITASTYLYFVHLLVAGEPAICSDNYFELSPGETCEIVVRRVTSNLDVAELSFAWR
jgi:beta-mannosidase